MAGCVNFSDMKLHEWRRRRREIGTDERAKGWGVSFNRRLKKAPPPPLLGDRATLPISLILSKATRPSGGLNIANEGFAGRDSDSDFERLLTLCVEIQTA